MGRPDVGCVLLAAGTSSRMGKNKLFLEIDGEDGGG
jgi:CTP:molybdopterin cytidylyltransferase MocA